MKTNLSKIKWFVVFTLIVLTIFASAQDISKPAKDLYLSYFGNDSTSLNYKSIPCVGGDLWFLVSCTLYSDDTVRVNGNLYFFKPPQESIIPADPRIDYYFPRYDTLFLREDRTTGRLYRFYRNYFDEGEVEKVICDISLETGDTIPLPDCFGESQYIVREINYVNGLKKILLGNGWYNIRFNEGLLPDYYPFYYDETGYYFELSKTKLLCEHKDGVQVYGGANDCFPNLTNIEEIEDYDVLIYPNVVTNNDFLIIETSSHIKDVIITDMFSRTVGINKNVIDNNKWQISICQNLESGVYFIIVKTEKGSYYEKIILVD